MSTTKISQTTSNFNRYLKDVSALKNRLEEDTFLKNVNDTLIQTGKALLTFRNGNATIYYEGRQLCNMPYKSGMTSDSAYLPAIYNHYLPVVRSKTLTGDIKKQNLTEVDYQKNTNSICNFSSQLAEILDNMDKERDDEAYQVSGFYKFSPMLRKNCSTVVLLDIEAAFAQTGQKTDRIDMVLYNVIEKQLIFVEIKRLSDSRLYEDPKTNEPAEILEQLARYRDRLSNEKNTVIEAYNRVIEYYNELSDSDYKIPVMDTDSAADPLLGLMVVECTNTERYHPERASVQFQSLCEELKKNNFKMYTYGSLKNATPGTLLDIYNMFR